MKYLFYHIFLFDKVTDIVNEQLLKLKNSGLLNESELYINIIDIFNNYYPLNVDLSKYTNNIIVDHENYYEMMTLHRLYEHVMKHDGYYLYFHTKGISRVNDKDGLIGEKYSYKNVENWRHIMEHFNIEHWKECERGLDKGYDLVGCNYNSDWGTPHYSGNFWWSQSDFLRKLPDPLNVFYSRMNGEMWISEVKHKALCLYPLSKEHANRCYVYTPKEEYYNNIIKTEFNI